ncbi:MAG: M24 family metallopeptidase [Bacteroidetes bacterium]|nr:MAG: M24 family metallopeptidase [Bacteroidota bacterium]
MYLRLSSCLLLLGGLLSLLPAQPRDYLPADFHRERREALRQQLPEGSVAVFFASPVRNRANDVDYVYHQDPDFYYLTGYREPHAMLLLYAQPQQDAEGSFTEVLYVQPRNPRAEQWTGRRLGVAGAQAQLGLQRVYPNTQFAADSQALAAASRILCFELPSDVRRRDAEGSLYQLMQAFRAFSDYPERPDPGRYRIYDLIRSTEVENNANVAQVIDRYLRWNPNLPGDDPIVRYQEATSAEERRQIAAELPENRVDVSSLDYLMNGLREIKTPEELVLLRKAIDISTIGQREVMKAMHPDMSEMEVQGIHEFVYKKYGAEYEGYPSIVGAGENGCILHYIDNIKDRLSDELVLMDLGAEYHGYTADVTRTIPADGTFSPEQRAIYDIVYEAQEAAMRACRPGLPFNGLHAAAQAGVDSGLVAIGLVEPGAFHPYFPHGTSHYLGLDVHDRGNYGPLAPGMVLTIEPGIYIPTGSKCDPRWWGIAVRIEDDVLVTETGCELLSDRAPRRAEEIEALMAEPSALDDFVLPGLEE